MSLATTFQVARELISSRLRQPTCWVDAARLGRLLNHRQIFAHGAVGARAEEERGLLVIVPTPVLGAGERLARPPIVEHLVVVPLRDRGDLGIEREQVLVEEI